MEIFRRAALPFGAGAAELSGALAGPPLAQVFLFASPRADFARLVDAAARAFPGIPTVVCTTGGEIGPAGYTEDTIIALGLPATRFATAILTASPLGADENHALAQALARTRLDLEARVPHLPNLFAFVLIDGLSRAEDAVVSALAPALGPVPIFGGSAGDGRRFERTLLARDGHVMEDAAIVTLVATDCRAQVFSLDHMQPTDTRMVVTAADPETRTVHQINGAPAAREYARIVGCDPAQLGPLTFAAHPVVVRLGGEHHVRAIQRVTPEGNLVFFSAIDTGLVLSVARSEDMADHLDRELAAIAGPGRPAEILACDCILRRIEVEERQAIGRVSDVLARHRVTGFSTYGEQIGPMHVNHTMTGVALFPPLAVDAP